MTMDEIAAQEQTLILNSFTCEDAWNMGVKAREMCLKRGLAVSICIERTGQVLFQCALEGTSPDNDRWMAGKRRVVRLTHHSSLYAKEKLISRNKDSRTGLGLDETEYLCAGGCVPVRVQNVGVVGSVTVSGLVDSEDHALALEIVRNAL